MVHMTTLDLNLLRVFDALMQTQSVTAAALKLGLSQPATSHALGRLRDHFGDDLLVRGSRRMVPTARALTMHPAVRAALEQLEGTFRNAPTFDPSTSTRRFHLGMADYQEFVVLPQLLALFSEQAPLLDLFVHRQSTMSGLEEGIVDLILAPLRRDDTREGLKSRELLDDTFEVIMLKGHELTRKKLTLESYATARHAYIEPGGTLGGVVDAELEKRGLSRRVVLALPNFAVAPHVIAETDLVCTLPVRVARRYAELLALHVAEPPMEIPGFTISMAWHDRLDRDPGHTWLRQKLWDLFGRSGRRGRVP
jgi:DNA-binding transcriptional LysR family regulator